LNSINDLNFPITTRSRLRSLQTTLWAQRVPIVVGASFSLLAASSFLAFATFAEHSLTNALQIFYSDRYVVLAVTSTVGFSMGLQSYVRRSKQSLKAAHCSVAGSATSVFSMAACCLHHFTDAIAAGSAVLGSATSLLIQYRLDLVGAGIFLNLLGSALMLRTVFAQRAEMHNHG